MMEMNARTNLEKIISDALHAEIYREAELLIAEAQAKLEKVIRAKLGMIATTVLSEFSIERHQQNIVITVRDRRSA